MSGEDDRIRIWFDKNKDESDADEIKKFKELLDSGAITKEEYDTKKKNFLIYKTKRYLIFLLCSKLIFLSKRELLFKIC